MPIAEIPITGASRTTHLGRDCYVFDETSAVLESIADVDLTNGTIELEIAVSGERSFPGLAWRLRGPTYESFFVRPHQVGNDDAIQYTPVFNGVSAWQLYHGPGFWAPITFPIDEWFTVRVVFDGQRGEAYVADLDEPALVFDDLRVPHQSGGVGILPGRPGIHVARFAYEPSAPTLRGTVPLPVSTDPRVIPGWWVSAPVHEGAGLSDADGWQFLDAEPNGLTNLARLHPLTDELNTVFAKTVVRSEADQVRALDLGFSDRATVYLNGQPLFRGEDTYRSRDYRFLGSIGWFDTVYLPLRAGDNELVVAVSETMGGWGLQARFTDPTGLLLAQPPR